MNITDPLQKLSQLSGVYFDWDEEDGGHHDVGFIAEEVGLVLPEIVVYEQNGIDAVGLDYSKLTPLLVEATNALQQQYQERFDHQQNQINELKDQISEMSVLKKEMSELRTLLGAELAN